MIGSSARVLSGHMPRPRKPRPSRSPTALNCSRWRPVSAQVWWRFSSGAPDSSNWPAGSRLTVPSGPESAMTLPPSSTGCQPNSVSAMQQVADAAGLVIGRRAVVGAAVDELLVLGADAPASLGFSPPAKTDEQVVAALDRRAVAGVGARRHRRALAGPWAAPAVSITPIRGSPRQSPGDRHPRPPRRARRFRRAGCAGRAKSATALRHGADRCALLLGEAALGADQDQRRARPNASADRLAAALVGEIERARRGLRCRAARRSFTRLGHLGSPSARIAPRPRSRSRAGARA